MVAADQSSKVYRAFAKQESALRGFRSGQPGGDTGNCAPSARMDWHTGAPQGDAGPRHNRFGSRKARLVFCARRQRNGEEPARCLSSAAPLQPRVSPVGYVDPHRSQICRYRFARKKRPMFWAGSGAKRRPVAWGCRGGFWGRPFALCLPGTGFCARAFCRGFMCPLVGGTLRLCTGGRSQVVPALHSSL